jgi:peptidoglycan/xylan/chitin deacetylase (PgdA/CDA1 family)
LTRLQLRLASWTRRGFDTVTTNADTVFRRLADPLQGGDILLLHDGNAARSRGGQPVILEVLPRLLDAIAEKQLRPVTLRSAVPA